MTHSRSLARSTAELFEATLQTVEGKLAIVRKEDRVGIKLLSKFQGLKDYNAVFVHKVTELRGVNNSVIILLIEKHLTIIEHKKTGRIEKEIEEIEPILLFSVPQEMGRVWIRPETISDKLTDLITKVDIDFKNYPAFSSNYFVAGENP
ncbi:MAG TPA: hypothetical protein VFT90_11980, partial [Chryseosolibacter sp.]|nr:hypothetical protein [Chryseosolibacter sp.]